MRFNFDGKGVNDRDDPYGGRVVTLTEHGHFLKAGLVLAAAPELLAFAEAYLAMANEVTNKGATARPTVQQLNVLFEQAQAVVAQAKPKPIGVVIGGDVWAERNKDDQT